METTQKTILFVPLSAWGHINSCVQIARVLERMYNCKIIFITNSTWNGKLDKHCFRHETYTSHENSQLVPSQNWTDLVKQSGREVMGQSSFQKITTFGYKAYEHMINEVIDSDSKILKIIRQAVTIDLVVIDNYILTPSLVQYCIEKCIPWVRLRSASPVEVNPVNLPPQNSGYSIKTPDIQLWNQFAQKQTQVFSPLFEKFLQFFKERCPSSPAELGRNDFIMDSPHLNLYMYPKCIDYTDIRPMPIKWERINAVVEVDTLNQDEEYKFPEEWTNSWKVILLALGTFGSADLELMAHLISMLEEYPAYFVVCTGPHHSSYTLPKNMCGDSILPQAQVLTKVDAMICHGGNATVNECFYYGRPMILMPFFGDEYDNAERIHEEGFGVRLDPYKCSKTELFSALAKVTEDEMMSKMSVISQEIQQEGSGAVKAANLIFELLLKT